MREKIWKVKIEATIRNFDEDGNLEKKGYLENTLREGMSLLWAGGLRGEIETTGLKMSLKLTK